MAVVNVENAEHYTWGAGCDGWRLLNTSDLSVIQERIPAGLGEVKHYHDRARQLFYVLQGQLEIEADDETVQLERGDSFEISAGVEHQVRNPFGKETLFLVISAPSTQGDRVNLE